MANLDTTSKRRASVQILAPAILALSAPDGLIDQGDRQHSIWSYSGILAGAPVAITTITALQRSGRLVQEAGPRAETFQVARPTDERARRAGPVEETFLGGAP